VICWHRIDKLEFGIQKAHPVHETVRLKSGGITIFLEDDPDKINAARAKWNTTQIYKVDYQTPAKKAYKLLECARKSPACAPHTEMLQNSSCKLALKNLPQEVYELKWNVVAVDGSTAQVATHQRHRAEWGQSTQLV